MNRPAWVKFVPMLVLPALLAIVGPARVFEFLGLSNPLLDGRPAGFTIKDPLDPAMIGYRHPFYEGYIAPYDAMFPTTDPALADFAHERYAMEIDRSDSDPAYGWISTRVPDGVARAGEPALRPTACRIFRQVVAEPHHAGYRHLLIDLYADTGRVHFNLVRADCGV